MKVKRIITIALAVLVMSCVAPVYANAQPALPHYFYGTLLINGSDALAGTTVEAQVDGVTTGIMGNPIVTTEPGKYGSEDPLAEVQRLLVQGNIADGAEIEFYVNGYKADQTAEWHTGEIEELPLTVTIPVAPVGGGGGGGPAPDTTPPTISNVGGCLGGITDTTADICWTTNELSTSQVEYWDPSMLSTLDETLVTDHHVNLAGLTPATTYHYKTLSKDAAGNLAVSPEYTFTTLGKPPVPEPAPPEPAPPEPAPPAPAPPAPAPPAPPPEVAAPINWPVVGGVIAGVIVVGLLIFFLVRRRAY